MEAVLQQEGEYFERWMRGTQRAQRELLDAMLCLLPEEQAGHLLRTTCLSVKEEFSVAQEAGRLGQACTAMEEPLCRAARSAPLQRAACTAPPLHSSPLPSAGHPS